MEKEELTTYTSYDAYEDLELIRARLHEAKRKINRSKLEKADMNISFGVIIEDKKKWPI